MWQGKSLIPKPRLSTPRRTDPTPTNNYIQTQTPSRNPRTPSRLPRPPARSIEPPPNTPVTTTNPVRRLYQDSSTTAPQRNPASSRGDTLAERVIATGIITDSTQRSSYNTPGKSHFTLPESISNFAEPGSDKTTNFSLMNTQQTSWDIPPSTPPRAQKSLMENTFTTPVKHSTPFRDQPPKSPDELVIDEELVTRTPAKHKNTEWLASFGIDISLLKITDDEENQHPNLTPVRESYESPINQEKTLISVKSKQNSFQRRRATDFYGYAQSADTLSNPPTRIASARKSRRASARISVRELDALNFSKEEEPCRLPRPIAGSDVFLTPVRASRKQREKNGTPVVLSEVRRSLRINTPSRELVPKNSVRGRIELLEANDHSYIPNPCLSVER